jgi:hypothetical protein
MKFLPVIPVGNFVSERESKARQGCEGVTAPRQEGINRISGPKSTALSQKVREEPIFLGNRLEDLDSFLRCGSFWGALQH